MAKIVITLEDVPGSSFPVVVEMVGTPGFNPIDPDGLELLTTAQRLAVSILGHIAGTGRITEATVDRVADVVIPEAVQ